MRGLSACKFRHCLVLLAMDCIIVRRRRAPTVAAESQSDAQAGMAVGPIPYFDSRACISLSISLGQLRTTLIWASVAV